MRDPNKPLTNHTDAFLDYYKHSAAAYERVGSVLGKFEFMVDLASTRAIDALPIPTECVIIQFPIRHPQPDGVA